VSHMSDALGQNHTLDLDTLRTWAKQYLAPYKLPSRLHIVSELPRNAMGKCNKKALRAALQQEATAMQH